MTNDDDILVPMKCGHVYHKECLGNYAKSVPSPREHLRCPDCRLSAVDVSEAESRFLAQAVAPFPPTSPDHVASAVDLAHETSPTIAYEEV